MQTIANYGLVFRGKETIIISYANHKLRCPGAYEYRIENYLSLN